MTLLSDDHIGIDDGWQACGAGVDGSFHSASGEVLINETLFPDSEHALSPCSA